MTEAQKELAVVADALERLINKFERAVLYLGSDEEWAKVSTAYFREVLKHARTVASSTDAAGRE